MKVKAHDLLSRLPGPRSTKWPEGERFIQALSHGSLIVELYAPRGRDPQTPHAQDELYFVQSGTADLVFAGERHTCAVGDVFFVAVGVPHHFENISDDFATWVVLWGPERAH